jgi:hypothetical protein
VVLVGKPEGKGTTLKRKDNIKMDLQELALVNVVEFYTMQGI